jgi:hypothetical protein
MNFRFINQMANSLIGCMNQPTPGRYRFKPAERCKVPSAAKTVYELCWNQKRMQGVYVLIEFWRRWSKEVLPA